METLLALPDSTDEDEENPKKNPFKVPSDTELFSIRDKAIKKAQVEREKKKTMKVHEKTTFSTKMKEKSWLRKALKMEKEEERKIEEARCEERLKDHQERLSRKLAMKKDDAFKRETFHDYIQNRKQIFYLEHAIAVKRGEIQKMENIAKEEEKKLEKAERRMEKDVAMFDKFLKENHDNAVEALRIAKRATSAKNKKITELQEITTEIEKIQSDISRFEDTLQEYKMYRDMLYHLSPKEWQEKHRKRHKKEKDMKTESRINEGSASPPSTAGQNQGPTARTNTAHSFMDMPSSLQFSESLDFRSGDLRPQLKQFLKPLLSRELSSLEDAESEIRSEDEDEEPELYFTDPEQLLIAFTEMQDENLSLAQNSQDIEESWNKFQQTFITTHESTEKELAELKQQANALRASVAKEEEKLTELKLKVQQFTSEHKVDDQDKKLTSLNKKVQEVYLQCTGDNEENLPTVEMLKVIEKQLNDLLDSVEGIPPAKIEKAVKAIRKEQRARLREEKKKQAKQQPDEGLKRDMKRSQVPEGKKQAKQQQDEGLKRDRKRSQVLEGKKRTLPPRESVTVLGNLLNSHTQPLPAWQHRAASAAGSDTPPSTHAEPLPL